MVIFLYGSDTYRSKQKLEELREKFIQEVDKSALNFVKVEGEKLTPSKFKEAVLSPGFLARRRMIIIENICQNKNIQLQKEVLNYLRRKDNKTENIVIFWEGVTEKQENKKPEKFFSSGRRESKEGKLFDKLRQQKYAQEFDLLKGHKLNEWIKKEIIKRGGKIENQSIILLANYLGNNLWQISNEIEKLISYKQNKIITSDDINLLVKSKTDENVFNLVDALGMKNKKLALKLLNDQLENKTPWPYLMAMIIRQFRILLQIKSFPKSDGPAGLHPYVLQKAMVQAKNYSLEELKSIYQRLLKIDVQLKTTQIDPKVLFDLFIAK